MLIACKDSAALAFTGTGFLVAMPAYLREAVLECEEGETVQKVDGWVPIG